MKLIVDLVNGKIQPAAKHTSERNSRLKKEVFACKERPNGNKRANIVMLIHLPWHHLTWVYLFSQALHSTQTRIFTVHITSFCSRILVHQYNASLFFIYPITSPLENCVLLYRRCANYVGDRATHIITCACLMANTAYICHLLFNCRVHMCSFTFRALHSYLATVQAL